jgi:hypothetical protein
MSFAQVIEVFGVWPTLARDVGAIAGKDRVSSAESG